MASEVSRPRDEQTAKPHLGQERHLSER